MAFLAVGTMVENALDAADSLADAGIETGVVNCRFVKPLDETMLSDLSRRYEHLITVEENVLQGGFGSAVSECLLAQGDLTCRLHHMGIPDRFVTHGSRSELLREVGLNADALAERVRDLLNPSK